MEFIIICKGTSEETREAIQARPEDIQWREKDWRVSYGFEKEDVFLDIMYLSEFNEPANWTAFKGWARELINEHGNADKRDEFLATLDETAFGLTVMPDPAIGSWNDDRIGALAEYAQRYGAYVCTPHCIFDVELDPICKIGPWEERLFGTTVENSAMYFPTSEIPFKKLLPKASAKGGLFKSPSQFSFETEEGTTKLLTKPIEDEQKSGFMGYVAQQPNPGPARAKAQELISKTVLQVAVALPGPVNVDGPTFTVLIDLARKYDGFFLVGDSVMLADGTMLAGPLAEKDPDLAHPKEQEIQEVSPDDYKHRGNTEGVDPARVAMRERHYQTLAERGFQCARWMPLYRNENMQDELRPVSEIASRLLALKALFMWVSAPENVVATDKLKAFINRNELKTSLSTSELDILNLKRKKAQAEHTNNIGWRLENMWALCWVLGFDPAPTFYQGQLPDEVTSAMLFEFTPDLEGSLETFLKQVNPRSAAEVGEMEDLFYCTHNAVRSAQTGNLDAVPPTFHPVAAGGAVHERRHSLTWSVSPGIDWDDTDLST